jgi:phosphoribosylanthranilate isomerase
MLSGGVNSGNVDAAVLGTAARGVDISSGVETSPGEKDDALIKTFLARVREAEKSRPATAKKGCIA